MAAASEDERKDVLEGVLWSDADLEVIFPTVQNLQFGYQVGRFEMLEWNRDKLADELKKRGAVQVIEAVDLRTAGNTYSRFAKVIPAEIPFYQAIVKYEGRPTRVDFGAFVLVNGRWIWLIDLDRFAAVLPAE